MKIRRSLISCVLLCVCAVVALLTTYCNPGTKTQEAQAPAYLNHADTVKYVGIETCRTCHAPIYNTFIQTGMGQSFAPATKQKSAADFSGHHVVYDKFRDLHYTPLWRRDSLYIMEFRLQGRDTVYKRVEKVDYIVGSGQHTNSHMMNVNGYVYQMPLTWYAQKGKWDLPPGFEEGHNVRFGRQIGFECMSCHNALPGFEQNSMNKFTRIPGGIDCERCHGPGEAHVKEKMAGIRVDTATQIDYTIVNPRKLGWERQIDICQRCHLQGNAVLKEGKTFSDFRPGMRLSDFMDVYMPRYKGRDDEFIMASHAQRLQQSQCFIHSASNNRNEKFSTSSLTCVTCHNPHVSVKVTGRQVFNNACGNCHNMKSDCKETPAKRAAVKDNCVGCHMPRSGATDIPHVTVTDHKIRIPAKASVKAGIRAFAGIYCINDSRAAGSEKAQAYLNYYEKFEGEPYSLDSANTYLLPMADGDDKLELKIHFLYLRKDDRGIVQLANNLQPEGMAKPWTCYRIGQAYQNLQLPAVAEGWYRRSVALAAQNLDFINKLGACLVEQDKTEEAINVLSGSLHKNPKQSEALTNVGFAWLKSGNAAKALSCYNQALALDPDFEQALFNKAAVLNMQGDKKGSREQLLRILKRNPSNALVKQLLHTL